MSVAFVKSCDLGGCGVSDGPTTPHLTAAGCPALSTHRAARNSAGSWGCRGGVVGVSWGWTNGCVPVVEARRRLRSASSRCVAIKQIRGSSGQAAHSTSSRGGPSRLLHHSDSMTRSGDAHRFGARKTERVRALHDHLPPPRVVPCAPILPFESNIPCVMVVPH
jgi:hypothetical protein